MSWLHWRFRPPSFLELVRYRQVGLVIDGAKPPYWKYFFFGAGAMTILTGFAKTPLMFAVGLSGIGIFASIYHPVGMSWLVSRTSKTGTALGFNGLFGSIGFFLLLWLQEH